MTYQYRWNITLNWHQWCRIIYMIWKHHFKNQFQSITWKINFRTSLRSTISEHHFEVPFIGHHFKVPFHQCKTILFTTWLLWFWFQTLKFKHFKLQVTDRKSNLELIEKYPFDFRCQGRYVVRIATGYL